MNNHLRQFLDNRFKPSGDFPAREDVEQELLVNLTEKYNDLKAEGKTDEEAYKLTTNSFGDVSEIMEHVAPKNANDQQKIDTNPQPDTHESVSDSRFRAAELVKAD